MVSSRLLFGVFLISIPLVSSRFVVAQKCLTKLLVVGVPQLLRQLPDFTITLCGKPISPIPVAKDLGVFIDQYLSYDEHIRKTVASCMNKLIQINRIKHLLDKETLLLIILAGCFTAPQCGAILLRLISISFNLFKILQLGLSWDSANMTISQQV